jgi:NAD+ kinase
MKRVLVVYKRDAYQHYLQRRRDPHLIRLLRRRHPDVIEMRQAHAVHQAALAAVLRSLRRLGVAYEVTHRTNVRLRQAYDLVVSVGGDGTFLHAARMTGGIPLLGVNSDPSRSEAVFCAATRRTVWALCRRALSGALPQMALYRLRLRLNGRRLPQRPVNDVLIVHDNPATMSRYRLHIGKREEVQKSSGLWVSTAAGSSSAILAAGGRRLPWSAKRFQYRPRELYQGRLSHARLAGAILSPRQVVRVTWLMQRGSAFIDGPHVRIPLRFADRLEVGLSLGDPVRVHVTRTL